METQIPVTAQSLVQALDRDTLSFEVPNTLLNVVRLFILHLDDQLALFIGIHLRLEDVHYNVKPLDQVIGQRKVDRPSMKGQQHSALIQWLHLPFELSAAVHLVCRAEDGQVQ